MTDKPSVWVEMIVAGDDLRAAIGRERGDGDDLEAWANAMVDAADHRDELMKRFVEPAWAALVNATGRASLGEPYSYKLKFSVERNEE